ncbi:transporter [Hydrogenophaga sp. IBVHS2]|nr:transporter [Hydrogenophaga sp. IBVHS2]
MAISLPRDLLVPSRAVAPRLWAPGSNALAAGALGVLLTVSAAHAQPTAATAQASSVATEQTQTPQAASLRAAVEAAWERQPENKAAPLRRDAALAQRRVASGWTPEPAALEASTRTDRLTRNNGAREYEVGVAVPLWLPGERTRSQALADSELGAVDSRLAAARWRIAGSVREAWWAVQTARQDVQSARARLAAAEALAADVARRLRAGDLARADLNQAEGAVASALADLAANVAAEAAAAQNLRSLTGAVVAAGLSSVAEPEPSPAASLPADHPAAREIADKAETLRRSLALAQAQRRANPDLTLLTTRDRGAAGESYGQTITLGVRIPFGSEDRNRAKQATAAADLAEAEAALAVEQQRLTSELESSRARVAAARAALQAAERRAQLARETKGFIDKSFRAGETDLPSRLRVELEAAEAERQAARAAIELSHAISIWRQALGLLPQ